MPLYSSKGIFHFDEEIAQWIIYDSFTGAAWLPSVSQVLNRQCFLSKRQDQHEHAFVTDGFRILSLHCIIDIR